MPRAAWSRKDERQYKHIRQSCMLRRRSMRTCTRIAAATVNKQRSREGRTLSDLGSPDVSGGDLLKVAAASAASTTAVIMLFRALGKLS